MEFKLFEEKWISVQAARKWSIKLSGEAKGRSRGKLISLLIKGTKISVQVGEEVEFKLFDWANEGKRSKCAGC